MYLFNSKEYEIYNNLIDKLYHCTSFKQLQDILVEDIYHLVPSDSLILLQYAPDGYTVYSSLLHNLDSTLFSEYRDYYQQYDLYKERVNLQQSPPVVNRASDFIDYDTWDKNEHRVDFLLPQNIYHISCLEIIINNKIVSSLSLHRSRKHNDFNDRDINILYILAPVIKNTYQILERTSKMDYTINEQLTPREKQILPMLLRNLSNEQLAIHFDVSLNTMKTHIRHILGKMECSSRIDLLHKINNSRL